MVLLTSMIIPSKLFGQSCPENVGFEDGSFQNWKIYTGTTTINGTKNSVSNIEIQKPILGRHTIMSDKSLVDQYGKFPVIPKNGGNFSVKLGNNGTGSQADGISYLLSIPTDRPEFTLTYQYAIVLEDPNHLNEEQPRFIARIKDVETNEYIQCASFEYVATSGLPGFKQTNTSPAIIYKDWTPVTVNLSGYQGKKVILEFISTDCALGGHFGYAYIDVNNVCGDIIAGNTYCENATEINVVGPSGFQQYNWYNEDRSKKYGSGQSLTITPTPAEGSKLLLDLIPFKGFGCSTTVSTIVHAVNYQLRAIPKIKVCENSELDLTAPGFILNKSNDFEYLVFADKDLTQPVVGNVRVTGNKTYFFKATNHKGCESFASIDVSVSELSSLTIKNPTPVCFNQTVDITDNALIEGDIEGLTKAYFIDEKATMILHDPQHISTAGRYYIKLNSQSGCEKILPIEIKISDKPQLKITNPMPVCFPATVDLTDMKIFAGSDADLSFGFYRDSTIKTEIANPKNMGIAGTYYVKATNAKGCAVIKSIRVSINDLPVLSITNPEPVCYPNQVDLTHPSLFANAGAGLTFTFYNDIDLKNKVTNPKAVSKSGIYFVKATNAGGCFVVGKMEVKINELPKIVVHKPKPIFDNAAIDLTSMAIIEGSRDFVKVKYFTDAGLTRPVADPTRVNQAGTYYISIENENGCNAATALTLDILPRPKIVVPTAFTPQKETNNRLYPFLVSIQKLISFKVFNKWGIMVYQTESLENGGWDGQFQRKMQPLETFSWFAEGVDVLGSKIQSTGKTILIL